MAIALGSVLALTATACGDDGSGAGGDKGSEGSGKGEIVFWDNNGGVRTDIWKEVIADFEKANPDIDVEYVGIASTEYQSKVDTAIQGGGLPDVGGVGAAMAAGFAAQGALEPLDDRLSKSSLSGKLNESMVESLKSMRRRRRPLLDPDLRQQRRPLLPHRPVQGGGPGRADRLGHVLRGRREAHRQGQEQVRLHHPRWRLPIAQALDAMYGQSGITEFWDASGEKTTVNDPKNVEALEKYVGLYKKVTPAADLNNDFTKMVAQFDSGTIGMLNHNLGSYQDHVKAFGDKFRGIPQPTGPGGKRVQVSNPVDGLGMFKSSKNKEAAWKFIEFATSHEENSKFNKSAGQVPSNNDAAKDTWISEAEPTKLAAAALTDGSTTIVQLPYYLPDWNTISKADNEPAFQKVMDGQTSAKEFLDSLADQLNKAQAEWQKQKG